MSALNVRAVRAAVKKKNESAPSDQTENTIIWVQFL